MFLYKKKMLHHTDFTTSRYFRRWLAPHIADCRPSLIQAKGTENFRLAVKGEGHPSGTQGGPEREQKYSSSPPVTSALDWGW
jgi:hypothetical protein